MSLVRHRYDNRRLHNSASRVSPRLVATTPTQTRNHLVPCHMMWRLCDGCVCRVPLWFVFAGQSCATAKNCKRKQGCYTWRRMGETSLQHFCRNQDVAEMLQKNICNLSATFLLHFSWGTRFCNISATFPQHSCNIVLATKRKLHCNNMFVAGVARVNKTEMLQ